VSSLLALVASSAQVMELAAVCCNMLRLDVFPEDVVVLDDDDEQE